jgi:pimeloyl-ACP methyl ester carboxylesterase
MQPHSVCFLPTQQPQPHLPLFVFFPGMDGTGRLFDRQVDRLMERFDVRRLAVANNDRSHWSDLTEQAVKLIADEQSAGQELYLCGESFGACLAMQVAGKIGKSVNELVLINPASSFARFPLLAAGSVLSNLLPDSMYSLSAKILANFLVNADRVATTEQQSLVDAMLSVHPKSAAWRLALLRQFQVDTVVPKLVDIPTVLIAGERDRLLPSVFEVRILERLLPKSKMILLPNSGHACLLERDFYLADLL